MKTCALTGHRDLPSAFCKNALYDELETLIREGYDRFLCGMAAGFDLAAIECLVDLREKYKIALVACVPYRSQARGFSEQEKQRYVRLLEACDEQYILSGKYEAGCLLARNRYMVDHAARLIAVFDGQDGGTRRTVEYALRSGLEVVYVVVE